MRRRQQSMRQRQKPVRWRQQHMPCASSTYAGASNARASAMQCWPLLPSPSLALLCCPRQGRCCVRRGSPPPQVYRGGYSAAERRQVEAELFSGRLLGVAATNALELGVDIGALDITLHLGFQVRALPGWGGVKTGVEGMGTYPLCLVGAGPRRGWREWAPTLDVWLDTACCIWPTLECGLSHIPPGPRLSVGCHTFRLANTRVWAVTHSVWPTRECGLLHVLSGPRASAGCETFRLAHSRKPDASLMPH
eukprot:366380-Chlamydomonas_euryale.AAC.13